ncbi:unnamed protein product [Adineta ricciae]|uniref:Uncharacterized protein n=1 Tax=Adineta ricciae TaxID=249248 RepID=A0A816ATL0_ADIRI|nr:unnamed protein product [Adineta ricciae]
MRLLRCRRLLIYFIFSYILFFVILFREKLQLTTTRSPATTSDTPKSKALIFRSELIFNASSRYQLDLSNCWTDLDYQQWKDGKYFPTRKPKGNIVYMVQTGEKNLRTRCDIMMCTFGVTLHPSRLFFVGETASDSRLPVYDVVEPNTPRPVDRKGSMQKLAQGLDMVVSKLPAEYDSQRSVMIGQHTCKVGFCGGGGYLISRTLFVQLPAFVKKCRPHDELWDSDQFVPDCIRRKVQVEFIDRKEFNSQNPEFYSTPLGLRDHPNGFGRAVTFHYMKTPMKYVNLWRLHQAYMRE